MRPIEHVKKTSLLSSFFFVLFCIFLLKSRVLVTKVNERRDSRLISLALSSPWLGSEARELLLSRFNFIGKSNLFLVTRSVTAYAIISGDSIRSFDCYLNAMH